MGAVSRRSDLNKSALVFGYVYHILLVLNKVDHFGRITFFFLICFVYYKLQLLDRYLFPCLLRIVISGSPRGEPDTPVIKIRLEEFVGLPDPLRSRLAKKAIPAIFYGVFFFKFPEVFFITFRLTEVRLYIFYVYVSPLKERASIGGIDELAPAIIVSDNAHYIEISKKIIKIINVIF